MSTAYSIPQAKRQEKIAQYPGPGQYNPENSPKVTRIKDPQIGKEKRTSPGHLDVPGPGSYNTNEIKTHMHSQPSYSIGIKTKEYEESFPIGPGSYMVKYDMEKERAPAYSITKSKAKASLDANTPGPGNYEPFKASSVAEKGGTKFGHSKRQNKSVLDIPGPGYYNQDQAYDRYASRHQPQYGFGTSKNNQDQKAINVPGPGYYNAETKSLSKIGGIMSREIRSSMKNMDMPGPGAYNTRGELLLPNSPKFSLPKCSRGKRGQNSLPGPGYYQSPNSYMKVIQKSPNWKFNQEQRYRQKSLQTPGPGDYEISQKKTKVQGPYMSMRPKQHQDSSAPGPGSYEAKYEYTNGRSQMYSVGRGPRINSKIDQIPGPGSYQYDRFVPKTPGPTFTIQKRIKESKVSVPGPGYYDIKPMFADVPKYILNKVE